MAHREANERSHSRISRLGVGTVQFGLKYGISNTQGQTSSTEVEKIFDLALKSAVTLIDTASEYGNSESVIGNATHGNPQLKIVTKIPKIRVDGGTADAQINAAFYRSLENLKRKSIDGLLVHHAIDLLGPQGDLIWKSLSALKAQGFVKKIGVSVYKAEEIDCLLSRFPLDLIQLPLNVFDQRLLSNGYLALLKKHQIEIHVRSVFLQGLLLMNPERLDPWFSQHENDLVIYSKLIKEMGLTPIQAALGFVLSIPEVDHIICGVNSSNQLQELIEAMVTNLKLSDFERFAREDPLLLDPSKWQLSRREQ